MTIIEKLKQLRTELAFGADEEAAAIVGEAIDAINSARSGAIAECAQAVVMCAACDCTTKSRNTILALAGTH